MPQKSVVEKQEDQRGQCRTCSPDLNMSTVLMGLQPCVQFPFGGPNLPHGSEGRLPEAKDAEVSLSPSPHSGASLPPGCGL